MIRKFSKSMLDNTLSFKYFFQFKTVFLHDIKISNQNDQLLDDSFSQLNEYIDRTNPSLLLLLVDENTHEYCLPTVLANLETTIPFEIIEIEAGEEGKI